MAATAFALTYKTNELDKPVLNAFDTTGTAAAVHQPGYTVRDTRGREWMYVQHASSDVAAVAGAPAVFAQCTANDGMVVAADVSDGGGAGYYGAAFAGVFMSVLADLSYGWIQTRGDCLIRASTAPVAQGMTPLLDGYFSVTTAGSGRCVAILQEATTADVISFPNATLTAG